jgi:hypothetical protein
MYRHVYLAMSFYLILNDRITNIVYSPFYRLYVIIIICIQVYCKDYCLVSSDDIEVCIHFTFTFYHYVLSLYMFP